MADPRASGEETIVETFGKDDIRRLLDDHQKLLILYGFANAISTLLDTELLLNEAMNVVFGLVKAERGAIFLLDPKTGLLKRGTSRIKQTEGKKTEVVFDNAVIDWVLREKKALLARDAMADSRFENAPSVHRQGIRSCMGVPLASQHRILGIFYVDSQLEPGLFTKEQLTLVSGIATQTAVALENIESVQHLKEERKRVEDILNTLPIAILSIDEEGSISFVNPRAEKLFGIPSKNCLHLPYQSFFASNGFQPLLSLITPALEEGKKVVLEEVACGTSGEKTLLQVNIVPLREGAIRKGVLVALDDITEKKRLEREIANAEKLSAIGEMTAGLIHEINNPLNIISGRAQLLLMENLDAQIAKSARVIWEQVDRANAITEKLLSFARQRSPQLRPILLQEIMEKFLETMEQQFASQGIRVERKFSDVPVTVMGDPEQLEEVFINLSRNAIQAMPKGGTFSVITKKEKEGAKILFVDTGYGIPPEHLSKIFIPFFTTKGRGTGLGLSIVHGIVKNHGGTLKVQSQVGKGSTFILTLPLNKEGKG